MVCRTTASGSVVTSLNRFAQAEHNISDVQTLSLFHEAHRYVRNGGRTMRFYGYRDPEQYFTRAEERINRLQISDARRRSLLDRLTRARDEGLSEEQLDVIARFEDRMSYYGQSRRAFVDSIAYSLDAEPSTIEARLRHIEDNVDRSPSAQVSEMTDANIEFASSIGLPTERGTVAAVAQLRDEALTVARQQLEFSGRPAAEYEWNTTTDSTRFDRYTWINAGRYSAGDVLLQSADGQVQRLRFHRLYGQEARERAIASLNAGQIPENSFLTGPGEALDAMYQRRCRMCGQFRSLAAHECPTGDDVTRLRALRAPNHNPWRPVEHPITGNRYRLPKATDLTEALAGAGEGMVLVDFVPPVGYNRGGSNEFGSAVIRRAEDGSIDIETTSLRCVCGQFASSYTGTCPHIEEFESMLRDRALGRRTNRAPEDETEEQREARLAQQRAAREQRLALAAERAREAARDNWMLSDEGIADAAKTWQGDGPLMSHDWDAYTAALTEATSSEHPDGGYTIPYETTNALGGRYTRESGDGFGLELEYEFPPDMPHHERAVANARIGHQLYDAGLTYDPNQQGYGASKRRGYQDTHAGNWSFERDGSVNGGEIVTPVMFDEPDTWENIEKVTQILRDNGAVASKKAGCHIHVSSKKLNSSPAGVTELARSVTQHEDVLYRLASNPRRGTHRGLGYATPNQSVPPTGFTTINEARSWQRTRVTALNLSSVNGTDEDHTEFRLWDSTLEPGAIQTHIKLSTGLVDLASRIAANGGTSRGKEPLGSHAAVAKARGSRRRLTDEEHQQDTATFRSLLDAVFTRTEDKKQAIAVFASTKWNKPTRR